jgi:hypothetical protein
MHEIWHYGFIQSYALQHEYDTHKDLFRKASLAPSITQRPDSKKPSFRESRLKQTGSEGIEVDPLLKRLGVSSFAQGAIAEQPSVRSLSVKERRARMEWVLPIQTSPTTTDNSGRSVQTWVVDYRRVILRQSLNVYKSE